MIRLFKVMKEKTIEKLVFYILYLLFYFLYGLKLNGLKVTINLSQLIYNVQGWICDIRENKTRKELVKANLVPIQLYCYKVKPKDTNRYKVKEEKTLRTNSNQ